MADVRDIKPLGTIYPVPRSDRQSDRTREIQEAVQRRQRRGPAGEQGDGDDEQDQKDDQEQGRDDDGHIDEYA